MPSPPRTAVVLLAAGDGRRVGGATNKVLLPMSGLPVLGWSLRAVSALEYVDRVVLVVRAEDRAVVERLVAEHFTALPVTLVVGGDTRHASERNALAVLDGDDLDVVAIHDTARPLAGSDLFRRVIDAAAEHGGALPVRERRALIPLTGPATASSEQPARGTGSPRLVGVQTPQAFRAGPLLAAYLQADRDGFEGTDTAACIEEYTDLEIHCVPSPATNVKITFPEDVVLAERLSGAG